MSVQTNAGKWRVAYPANDMSAVMVEIALPNGALLARVTPDAVARLGLCVGGPVLALIKSTSIEVLSG